MKDKEMLVQLIIKADLRKGMGDMEIKIEPLSKKNEEESE